MSSATARFFSLLSTPLPLRYLNHHHRPFLLLLSSPRLFLSRSSLHLPRRFHFNAYAQTPTHDQFNDYSPSSTSSNGAGASPWPEWYNLINSFHFSRYSDRLHGNLGFEELVDHAASLPGDFVTSVNGCLAFAREHESLLWSLSRQDLVNVVDNGSPFLFKDAADTMRRMKLFLSGSTDHVMGCDKPSTVDVMKFLLSYACTTLVSSETYRFHNREIVEESVRSLFGQLADISGAPESILPASVPNHFPGTSVQHPRSFEQNVQMKKGDWICPRCSFMNFARNMKCLECEETRPKRQLTGGEWECPQCDFFNYGKNVACLRCDCKKPGISNPVAGSGYNYNSNTAASDKQSNGNQERVPGWLHKISQLENTSDKGNVPSLAAPSESASPSYDDFPENMPLRKEENRFVVREKKDRSLTSPLYKRQMAMEQSKSNNYVPFVPFPPNYFTKNQQPIKEEPPAGNSYSSSSTEKQTPISPSSDDQKSRGQWRGSSLEGSAVKEPDPLDMSEEAKAERWFRRVAQIKDIKELSEIPDEDFPSIMPMRKGVNRFVVSKRKTPLERRLASSQYRRNLPVVKSDPLNDNDDTDTSS